LQRPLNVSPSMVGNILNNKEKNTSFSFIFQLGDESNRHICGANIIILNFIYLILQSINRNECKTFLSELESALVELNLEACDSMLKTATAAALHLCSGSTSKAESLLSNSDKGFLTDADALFDAAARVLISRLFR
jgi:hypothetical protein